MSDLVVKPSAAGDALNMTYHYGLRRYNAAAKRVAASERIFWDDNKQELRFEGDVSVEGKSVQEANRGIGWSPSIHAVRKTSDGRWKAYAFPSVLQFDFVSGSFARRTLNGPTSDLQICVTYSGDNGGGLELDPSLKSIEWMLGDWVRETYSEAETNSEGMNEWTHSDFDDYLSAHVTADGMGVEICYGFSYGYAELSTDHCFVRERLTRNQGGEHFDVEFAVDRVDQDTGHASIGRPGTFRLEVSGKGDLRAYRPGSDELVFAIRRTNTGLRRVGFIGLGYASKGGKFRSWTDGLTVDFRKKK